MPDNGTTKTKTEMMFSGMTWAMGILLVACIGFVVNTILSRIATLEAANTKHEDQFNILDKKVDRLDMKVDLLLKNQGIPQPK